MFEFLGTNTFFFDCVLVSKAGSRVEGGTLGNRGKCSAFCSGARNNQQFH